MKRKGGGFKVDMETTGKLPKKKSFQGTTPAQVCADVVSGIVGVYVFAILTVFPLFATDMYFDILVDKYYFFWISTALMVGLSAIVGLTGLFVDCKETGGAGFRSILGLDQDQKKRFWQRIREGFRLSDGFLLLFLLSALLSTIFSEWPYEAFWGNMGRYQGFFTWIWYAAAYFMVTRFFRMKQWYFDIFLAAGLYLAVWGIQDYLGLDPHGWLYVVEDGQKAMFTSTIGNINTYTAVVVLYLAVSAVLFVTEGSKGFRAVTETPEKPQAKTVIWLSAARTVYYGICAVVFFMAMITGQSDNAVLGVMALLCFLPFYAWKNRRGFVRYLLTLAGFFLAMCLTRALTLYYDNSYAGFWSGTLLGFSEKAVMLPILLGLAGLTLVIWLASFLPQLRKAAAGSTALQRYDQAMEQRLPVVFRWVWLGLGVIACLLVIWLFWDANHGGHPEWYDQYANIFYFNNDWGTHRGHNWGILMRHIQEFPLWKKLIGAGPETYGIVTRIYDYHEMIDMYGEIYDSPHNEFLQYLFTTGILGFVGYYGFLISNSVRALNIKRKPSFKQCGGPLAAAGVFAAGAYTASSFINISVPIVVPLMLIILFIGTNHQPQSQAVQGF